MAEREMDRMRTGFIGLGQQGGPMAERMLGGGYPLTLWARRADAAKPFLDKGAALADSIAELGDACDYIAVCVVDDAGVAEICDPLIPAMRAGSILVIHSTFLPESCEALARRCAERGIDFLDAPVSGGGGAAMLGKLTVMCGGAPEAFERALPVIETYAETIVHLGQAGAAQRAKIVNNALMAATMGLAHAALTVGKALGIERGALTNLIKASSGRSFGFEVYARLPEPRAFQHGAPLLAKDVNLLGAILPGHPAAAILSQASREFLADALGESNR